MTQKEKQTLAEKIAHALQKEYPEAVCALSWEGDPWKLMVMGSLSAQCTDERVNLVCKNLFSRFPTAKELAKGELTEIESLVHSCGLYRTKAKNIKEASRMIAEDFGGILPDNMEELLRLPGVGRKVANLLLGDVYHKGGTVTDTHCIRICGRLGFYPESEKTPTRVEKIMDSLLPKQERSDFCHRIVQFGRDTCTAKNPKCADCPMKSLCKHAEKTVSKKSPVIDENQKNEKNS